MTQLTLGLFTGFLLGSFSGFFFALLLRANNPHHNDVTTG